MPLSLPPPPNTQPIATVEDAKGQQLKVSTSPFWQSWLALLQQLLSQLIPPGGAQAAIQFKDEGSDLGAIGTVTAVDVVGANVTATRSGDTVTITEISQAPLQFKDEGSNLGTAGTVTSLDAVGGGATLTRIANALTLTVPSPAASQAPIQFKDEGVDLGTIGTATSFDVTGAGAALTRVGNALTLTVASVATTPGGADTDVQYNDAGSFGGDSDFTWNKGTRILTLGTSTYATITGGSSATIGQSLIAKAGNGPAGAGGALLLQGGSGSYPNAGGKIELFAGSNGITIGGTLTVNGAVDANSGGSIDLLSGLGTFCGNINLTGQDTAGVGGSGGSISVISGGNSGGGATSGYVVISTRPLLATIERFRILANGAWSVGATGTDTGSAGAILRSAGSAAIPVWSTTLWPNAGISGGILGFTSTTQVASSILLTANGIILGGGAGATPTSTAAMTDGQILVGQTSAAPLPKTMSGDSTLAASGALTLATVNSNVGTFGDATNVAQITVNGKGLITAASNVAITAGVSSIAGTANQITASAATGAVTLSLAGPHNFTTQTAHGILLGEGAAAIVATAAMTDGQLLIGQTSADPLPKTVSGDVTVAASGAATIASDAVTNAKLANMATQTIKGRTTAGTGDPEDLTPTQVAAMLSLPQVTVLTSGSGTYTTPTDARYLSVEMVGGGGGGAGSGTGAGNGGAGGNTTFGSSFLTCNGGGAGSASSAGSVAGGAATGGDLNLTGGNSTGANGNLQTGGGGGGFTPFGGAPPAGPNQTGTSAAANTGAGGGGGGDGIAANAGGGGSAGGYLRKIVTSPSATYAYAVGAGGTAGTLGTSGTAGGTGGTGLLIVIAHFQ